MDYVFSLFSFISTGHGLSSCTPKVVISKLSLIKNIIKIPTLSQFSFILLGFIIEEKIFLDLEIFF